MSERDELSPGAVARARELFHRLLEASAEERRDLLDGLSREDALVSRELRRLWAAHEEMGEFLAEPPSASLLRDAVGDLRNDSGPGPSGSPETIGDFRLIRWLGEGGMGVVYEAEQSHPRRRVALKVMRSGLLTDSAALRFRREAELLGRLQHPGVAHVHQAGVESSPAGALRYFAMELVAGASITAHARQRRLAPRERVQLLLRVCDAVEHAHARGVIHRDLKPANLLVTEEGQPKVLDFGVARPVDLPATTATLVTGTGQLIGTLPYMSPEQAAGRPDEVDERADVYSLGVVAFELLAGRLPHELDDLSLPEALHVIRETSALRLSSADPTLRGDLDAIVGKALAKDPARRYASVSDLSADLRRYLVSEPIIARPPSWSYRAGRFARRHRLLVAAALTVTASLTVGLVLATSFAIQSRQAELAALRGQYRATLSAAISALDDDDAIAARRQLDASPVPLRGWEWHHLVSRLDESLAHFDGYAGEESRVQQLVFLEDDRGLLVRGDRALALVDLASRERTELISLQGTPGLVRTVSSDGRSAVVSRDGALLTVGVASGEERRHAGAADFLAVSLRGNVLAVGGDSAGTGRFVDVLTGRELAAFSTAPSMSSLSLSPDGRFAKLGKREDDPVRAVIETGTGAVRFELGGPEITSTQFSSDGDTLVTGHVDGSIRIWDVRTGEPMDRDPRPVVDAIIRGVHVSPDGSRIVIVDEERRTVLLDIEDGSVVAHLGRATRAFHWARPAFSHDGRHVAAAGAHASIVVARSRDGRIVHRQLGHERALRALAWSRDGSLMASLDESGAGRLWSTQSPTQRMLRGHDSFVYDVDVSADGSVIASAGWDGTARLWSSRTGEPLATLASPTGVREYGYVSMDRGGTRLVSAHLSAVTLWDLASGEPVFGAALEPPGTVDYQSWQVTGVGWHPSGRLFVASSLRRQLHAWTVAADGTVSNVERWPVLAESFDFCPQGERLAVSVPGGDLEIWDVDTRARRLVLSGHEGRVRRVAFSPDGRKLASVGHDWTARTWDVATGRELHVLRAHSDKLYAVAWHPDGTRLATGGNDELIRLWDVETGAEVATLRGHEAYVHALAFTPDGQTLVSGSGDTTVRLWETTPLRDRLRAIGE